MIRNIIISFFLILVTACGAERIEKGDVWQVKAVSSDAFFVKSGMIMKLTDDSVTFAGKEQRIAFHILKNNDRLVMVTGTSRLLFSIERNSDSTLVWHELYSPLPLKISFSKETNQ